LYADFAVDDFVVADAAAAVDVERVNIAEHVVDVAAVAAAVEEA